MTQSAIHPSHAYHPDPNPPGKVGLWLFLASEVMFFIGILGSYIVLRGASPELFRSHAESLNKILAATNTLVLIFSSLTMALAVDAAQRGLRRKLSTCLLLTLLCAFAFLAIKYVEYQDKFTHATLVAKQDGQTHVYDGHVSYPQHWLDGGEPLHLHGYRSAKLPDREGFSLHQLSEADVKRAASLETGTPATPQDYTLPASAVVQTVTYGPWKNIFFASYFTLTGIHGLHVIGGIVALLILYIQSLRGKLLPAQTEYVGLYWHFVDLVWIFLFPMLYLM
jgi:cytochrome c oxidase subunit 3